jgi:hypothetical protein
MTNYIFNLADTLRFAWMAPGPIPLSAGLMLLGLSGLLLGIVFVGEPEDPSGSS